MLPNLEKLLVDLVDVGLTVNLPVEHPYKTTPPYV